VADYRLSPQVKYPVFLQDSALAVRWVFDHLADLGGDPRQVFVMGHSAGAYNAAMLALDPRWLANAGLAPQRLAGWVGLAGPYDFLPIRERKVQQVFPDRERWPDTQPGNFVDGDEPPFLLLHGMNDHRVKQEQSERMAAKLQAAGVPVKLTIVPRTRHIAMVNGFLSPWFSPALADTLSWINGGEAAAVAAAGAAPAAKGN